jgi:hypothetical protein
VVLVIVTCGFGYNQEGKTRGFGYTKRGFGYIKPCKSLKSNGLWTLQDLQNLFSYKLTTIRVGVFFKKQR